MVKQNINIIDFETLYNILEEIEINLSFEIYNYKNKDEFLNDLNNNNKDLTNSIIVLKSLCVVFIFDAIHLALNKS